MPPALRASTPPRVARPRTWTYTYNGFGQVVTADGPRTDVADVTTTTYYAADDPDMGKRGNIATISNALGHVTSITAYDLNGNPLSIADANGTVTTLAYDLRQRLTSRQVGSELTTYQYDGVGQLLKASLPDGSYVAYTWDAAHRLTDITDAAGNTVHYTLDAMGNRIKEDVKDTQGTLARTRARVYDALNRLAQEVGGANQITAYEYDPNGNRTKITDPLAHSTVTSFDALNRLIRITDPGNGQTQLAWDGQDRLARVTDPRNLNTSYTVDGLGNRTQLTSPDTGVTTSTFDAAGNELTRTDAKGQKTSTTYDALNRPTLITYHDGSQVRYVWDQGTNGIGRLTRIEEINAGAVIGSLQSAYDAQGRLISETRTQGSVSHTTAYTYTGGQLATMTLPSGRQLSYTRNGAGQVSRVTLTDTSGQQKVIADAVAYHPFGGVRSWADGAGQTHAMPQDRDGRPTSYTLGSSSWLLGYDAAGRINAQMDGANAANSATYGYDTLDRLTNAGLPTTSYGYGYDATGNRTSQTIGGAARTYNIDRASNRLQTSTGTPPATYTHDATGNITSDGQSTYAYDARGRMKSATTGLGTTTYRVNALGQRVRKTSGTTDVIFAYDTAGHLIAEADASGAIQREYLWLDDTPLAVVQ